MAKKANNQQTTALTLSSDSGIAILQQIEELRSARKKILETPFKTGGLKLRGQLIKECTSMEELTKMLAEVIHSERIYSEAQQVIGVPVKQWNVDGHTRADIEHDIKLRISIVSQQEQDRILSEMEKLASKYVTPAEERERDMKALNNLLQQVVQLNTSQE